MSQEDWNNIAPSRLDLLMEKHEADQKGEETLTLQNLKDMEPREIFATGTAPDDSVGINMTNSGAELRWVAVRGGIEDWAIYVGGATNTQTMLRDYGDKIHDKETIKKLVPCDDEAFKMYRH